MNQIIFGQPDDEPEDESQVNVISRKQSEYTAQNSNEQIMKVDRNSRDKTVLQPIKNRFEAVKDRFETDEQKQGDKKIRIPSKIKPETLIVFDKKGDKSFNLTGDLHVKSVQLTQRKNNIDAMLRLNTSKLSDQDYDYFKDKIRCEVKQVPGVSDDLIQKNMDTLVLRLYSSQDTQFLTDYLDVSSKKRKVIKNKNKQCNCQNNQMAAQQQQMMNMAVLQMSQLVGQMTQLVSQQQYQLNSNQVSEDFTHNQARRRRRRDSSTSSEDNSSKSSVSDDPSDNNSESSLSRGQQRKYRR